MTAAPVAPDTDIGDDGAVIVEGGASFFGYSVAVWTELTAALPVEVLGVYLGEMDDVVLAQVRERRGGGAPIVHPLDERAQVRDAIADRMDVLAAARPDPLRLPARNED